ncbi:hypothetical protein CMO91_05390 [Candidatus Woesearchaeota archaeon]|nr:hypothetical protein [Candidatus Woesearchaeota archaeon]
MKKILILLLLLFACGSQNDTFDVGVIVPLTGPASYYSQNYVKGMELALEETPGIQIHVQDGKLDSTESIKVANSLEHLVDPEAYLVVFGVPTHAVAPLLQETGKPLLYEAYTRDIAELYPNAYKSNFDAQSSCKELTKRIAHEKIGVLFANIMYTDECLKGIRQVTDVTEYRYPYGNLDFRTLLLKAEKDGIERLFIMGLSHEILNMFKQLTEMGSDMRVACAASSECIIPLVEKSIPQDRLKGTLSVDYIPETIVGSEFGKKYLQKYPEAEKTEIMNAAAGFEAIKVLASRFGDYTSIIGTKGFQNRIMQTEHYVYEYDGGWKVVG